MRAFQLKEYVGPAGLELVELPAPEPAPDAVLVDVRAIGINSPDLLMIKGQFRYAGGAHRLLPRAHGRLQVPAQGGGPERVAQEHERQAAPARAAGPGSAVMRAYPCRALVRTGGVR